ncbi:hypothetical protein L6273_06520, partial [Candidatus Parcubacteria bacterium]|nr:hypothetical protein [Candidatus Parcubacteria bacterium]
DDLIKWLNRGLKREKTEELITEEGITELVDSLEEELSEQLGVEVNRADNTSDSSGVPAMSRNVTASGSIIAGIIFLLVSSPMFFVTLAFSTPFAIALVIYMDVVGFFLIFQGIEIVGAFEKYYNHSYCDSSIPIAQVNYRHPAFSYLPEFIQNSIDRHEQAHYDSCINFSLMISLRSFITGVMYS